MNRLQSWRELITAAATATVPHNFCRLFHNASNNSPIHQHGHEPVLLLWNFATLWFFILLQQQSVTYINECRVTEVYETWKTVSFNRSWWTLCSLSDLQMIA